jgi:N-terminal half of MaoC dehydratase
MSTPGLLTDAVRALIGRETPWMAATHPVEASEVRRFHHATLDPAPRYWDPASPGAVRAGGVVAPPAFPVHALRRAADAPDPLDIDDGNDFGGYGTTLRPGLPPLGLPLSRLLNGGYTYEFFRYARVGERIVCRSRYKDIYEKDGASGAMVFVVLEDDYAAADGTPLLRCTNTMILR